MFHVTADNRFPYWLYGGQQESGSAGVVSRSDDGEITFRDWHPVGVEEYGYAVPDPLDPEVVFGGKVSRYDRRTGQVQQVGRSRCAARATAPSAPSRWFFRRSIRTSSTSPRTRSGKRPTV